MKTETLTENKLTPSKGEWEAINNHARYAGNYPKTLVVANGKQVANCYIPKEENNIDSQQAEANAAFICKAVNNYDSLLNALKDFCDLRTAYSGEDFNKAYHNAYALIQKVDQ